VLFYLTYNTYNTEIIIGHVELTFHSANLFNSDLVGFIHIKIFF
jgi:hypothetical protein